MPLQATSGAASYDAFGGGAAAALPTYIEDVFSTYLYTGTGANQTIVNGVDLSGSGGLTWIKNRAASNQLLMTTAGGPTNRLRSNGQPSYVTSTAGRDFSSFNSNGFSLGIDEQSSINTSLEKYVSWSFRKQPKFFDVVTWTGNGTNRTIAHNLGSVPGCIIIGATAALGTDWAVYHRSLANTEYLALNSISAKATGAGYWNSTTATSSVFSLGTDGTVNYNTGTYIAYLFAHDAGGFGLTGTDNVISCGSYTGVTYPNSLEVTLGYEPQFVIIKNSNTASGWTMWDIMRGMSVVPAANTAQALLLEPNTSAAESNQPGIFPTATGFVVKNGLTSISSPSDKMIYIAIRRGPMKVPTDATKVFLPVARTGTGTNPTVVTTGTNPDLLLSFPRTASPAAYGTVFFDKLRGVSQILQSANTNAEATTYGTFVLQNFLNTGFQTGADFIEGFLNYSGSTYAQYAMTRAPGFFDEVCYTGTGVAGRTVTHNLTVTPEIMIVKGRSNAGQWRVYSSALGATQAARLNSTDSFGSNPFVWNNTAPTASVFTVGDDTGVNENTYTYVAYLFATCPGVSKVGTYTGTGTTQTINCGFTAGSRFVMIKRTDSTGDWYVWDSARGISSSNDPYLLLNSTAAEVTGTNYVDTDSTGFKVTAAAPAELNANGGTYIFLAIA